MKQANSVQLALRPLLGNTQHEWTSYSAMEDIFKFIKEKLDQATDLERSNEKESLALNKAVEATIYFSAGPGGDENSPSQSPAKRDNGKDGFDSLTAEGFSRDHVPLEGAGVAGESLRTGNAPASVVMEMPTTAAGTQGTENFEGQSAITGPSTAKPPDSAIASTFALPSAQNRTFLSHSLLRAIVSAWPTLSRF